MSTEETPAWEGGRCVYVCAPPAPPRYSLIPYPYPSPSAALRPAERGR
jgi:hypothetical protein